MSSINGDLNNQVLIAFIDTNPLIPEFYKNLLNKRLLSFKEFLFCIGKSFYQAFIIYFGGYYISENHLTSMISTSFTILVFVEVLNIYMDVINFIKLDK